MGGCRVSLIGATESAAAGLDAVDPQAVQDAPGDGETTAVHQSAADRPAVKEQEDGAETTDLRAHQARLPTATPHSRKDGQRGRNPTGFHRNRYGLAFWKFNYKKQEGASGMVNYNPLFAGLAQFTQRDRAWKQLVERAARIRSAGSHRPQPKGWRLGATPQGSTALPAEGDRSEARWQSRKSA